MYLGIEVDDLAYKRMYVARSEIPMRNLTTGNPPWADIPDRYFWMLWEKVTVVEQQTFGSRGWGML